MMEFEVSRYKNAHDRQKKNLPKICRKINKIERTKIRERGGKTSLECRTT